MKVDKHSKKIREIDFQLFPKVAEMIWNDHMVISIKSKII